MSSKNRNPHWWQLYIGLPLLCALYLPEMRLRLTSTEHVIAQLGILGLIYAFLQFWLRANRRALMGTDVDAVEKQGGWRIRIYEFPAAERVNGEIRRVEQPLMPLPTAEVKGVLSTTFEIGGDEPEMVVLDNRRVPIHKD